MKLRVLVAASFVIAATGADVLLDGARTGIGFGIGMLTGVFIGFIAAAR